MTAPGLWTPRGRRVWTLGDPEAPDLRFNGVDEFGIEWAIVDPKGWYSSPPVNLGLEDKPTHGAWFGRGAYKARVLEINGAFRNAYSYDPEALDAAAERLQAALDPEVDTLFSGNEAIPKQLTVRPSGEVVAEPVPGHRRLRRISAVLTAGDPFKYAAGPAGEEELELALLDPESVQGAPHPMEHPLDHGGAPEERSNRKNATNIGQVPALPVLRIVGPVPEPRVTNATTGQVFELGRYLAPDVEAVIDMEQRSVTVGGSSDFGAKAPRSTFWALAKGPNDVRFTAAAYEPAARAYLSWRPRWK